MGANPALLARPKAPKPYQTDATKSRTDVELHRITSVIAAHAAGDNLVAKRDLALLMYTSTGLRREEVIGLRGADVKVTEEGLVISGQVKGGATGRGRCATRKLKPRS